MVNLFTFDFFGGFKSVISRAKKRNPTGTAERRYEIPAEGRGGARVATRGKMLLKKMPQKKCQKKQTSPNSIIRTLPAYRSKSSKSSPDPDSNPLIGTHYLSLHANAPLLPRGEPGERFYIVDVPRRYLYLISSRSSRIRTRIRSSLHRSASTTLR